MARRLAASLAGLGVLLLLAPSPATAAQKTLVDARRDAPARFDITTVRATNTTGRLTVSTRFRALDGDGTQIFGFSVQSSDRSESYMVTAVRRPSGRVKTVIDGTAPTDQCTTDTTWSPRQDVIEVSVVGQCLLPGAVRVTTFVGAGDGSYGDPSDFTRGFRVPQD
ncbi:hypothetical protein [Nocardioides flavescens]|uniref:Uncharacterized protein n=1 Tax=Nocardioides flavescens TaxID=2691959 RepID=A0A6L7EZS0_9ACTN|nr:hypothetical protein [Nocardioides flavescens]MXG91328.1 hypothetical protein [Nocardioides flavescens]